MGYTGSYAIEKEERIDLERLSSRKGKRKQRRKRGGEYAENMIRKLSLTMTWHKSTKKDIHANTHSCVPAK